MKKSIIFHIYLRSVLIVLLLTLLILYGCFRGIPKESITAELASLSGMLKIQLARFEQSHLISSKEFSLHDLSDSSTLITFDGSDWTITWQIQRLPDHKRAYLVQVTAQPNNETIDPVALGLQLEFARWSTDNYVLMPAAAYQGNRFNARFKTRGKHLCDLFPCSPKMEISINTINRLNIGKGISKIDMLSGDMSTPSIGIHWPSLQSGFFLLTNQGTGECDYGYMIEESSDRSDARIRIRMPAVREDSCILGNKYFPSPDRGIQLNPGDLISVSCMLYFFEAPDIQSLFNNFLTIRKDAGKHELKCEIPYSAAWQIQEKKYNSQNWVEDYGYYSVGMRESTYQDWQTGWVGGMNAVFPLLVNGNEMTRKCALKTFDFLYDTISPSGFFFEVFYNGDWIIPGNMSFLRRNSDALYFIIKSYKWIKEAGIVETIPGKWEKSARRCADAYVRLFEKYGHFGQWIDYATGDIVAGSTASNGIAPAALALCSKYFNDDKYLIIATASAKYYYENFIRKGITNGGPGDIFQAPDSESAFGLLESFVVLYETTGDKRWLKMAEETAAQCATWVVSYNFRFPPQSTYNRLDMRTTGTVIANVQNKHAAPGICSLSGNSLFKLYRYTGKEVYLDLISDIARTIPQYMSRTDRPIPDIRPDVLWRVMDPGWINERVNMSDWEERGTPGDIKRGEIFGGSTWSEVACMLTYAELPGIYILKDKDKIWVLDNVKVEIKESSDRQLVIQVTNPTGFDALFKILSENSDECSEILDETLILDCEEILVTAGESKDIFIER